jgi:hypothetical protein
MVLTMNLDGLHAAVASICEAIYQLEDEGLISGVAETVHTVSATATSDHVLVTVMLDPEAVSQILVHASEISVSDDWVLHTVTGHRGVLWFKLLVPETS